MAKRTSTFIAVLRYAGSSSDLRTNRWEVDCTCGYTIKPSTTMFATQAIQCPRCAANYVADYRTETLTRRNGDG